MPRKHPNPICIKSSTYVNVFFRVCAQKLGEHTPNTPTDFRAIFFY